MNGFKVCYVSSEVAPFADSKRLGNLANYARSLPISLKETDQDVRLMMPKYKSINERKFTLREVIRLREVPVSLNNETKMANGKTAFLPDSKVHVYFLSFPDYFDRKGIYSESGSKKPYEDNALRFAFFCKGILETLKLLYWQPDIIHCNDWTTALIPYYLKTEFGDDEFFSNTRTVLSINNIDEQGLFPADQAAAIGINPDDLTKTGPFWVNKQMSFLKAGLSYADQIIFTGLQVADDILAKPNLAGPLKSLIEKRAGDINGAGKGASYVEWDPAGDKYITYHFDAYTPERKDENKTELQEDFNLDKDTELPLLAVLGNLNEESGFEVMLEALRGLMKKKIQIVVMPKGPTHYIDALESLESEYPERFKMVEKHDKKLAHRIMAAADMVLIPSKDGMGGENHLIGLRYGAIPILINAGDFPDDITAYNSEDGSGNGFMFDKLNKNAVSKAIQSAIDLFAVREQWRQLQKNCMLQDHSWNQVSQNYLTVYQRAGL